MTVWHWLLIVLGIFVIISIGGLIFGFYYTYKMSFRANRRKKLSPYVGLDDCSGDPIKEMRRKCIDEFLQLPTEQVWITSRDGLRLSARYYHQADGAPIEILCHGFRSCKERDFCAISKIGLSLGHNLFMIDQRAHGDSDGDVISYGIKERFDVIDWIAYVNERFGSDTQIILYGLSMGAATVLMAAGEELPENVRCVVADCPFSAPLEIILHVSSSMGVPTLLVGPMARISARVKGFCVTETSPVEAVKRAKIPILLLHGDEDDLVPFFMGERIAAANPAIQFEKLSGARHALCCLTDAERYTSAVVTFMKENLSE